MIRRSLIFLGLLLVVAAGLVRPADTNAQAGRLCFNVPEITHCIEGRFRQYWEQNGGLAVFGYPITAANYERSRDTGVVYLTQWFERNRFELHPELGAPYDVLLGRLGDDRMRQVGRDWQGEPRAAGPVDNCLWFTQTGHNVCDQAPGMGFKSYFQTHGLNFDGRPGISPEESLALLGLPLTEPRLETNSSGDHVLTQWFERARLEWHPGNPDPYKVLLGLLGHEIRDFQPPIETNCERPVVEELRRHYLEGRGAGRITFQQMLGCPQFEIRDLPAAWQPFEGGQMVWHAPTASRGSPPGWIHVVFLRQNPPRYISYPDLWQEGQPESGGEVPPAGVFEPRRGFGKVWREQPGVRQHLSWATAPERQDRAVLQVFRRGSMLWLMDLDLVYVLINDSDLAALSPRIK